MVNWSNPEFLKACEEWKKRIIEKAKREMEEQVYHEPIGSPWPWGGFTVNTRPPVSKPPLDPPRTDPHQALIGQIAKLKDVEPVRVGKRIPDYTHTITAWRGWDVKNEQLKALGQSGIWRPKMAKAASCSGGQKGHRAPSKECQCGYWSFKTMDLLTEALKNYTTSVTVIGAVEIWGRVIECENGFRSEFAYPKELWLLKPDMEYLSLTYGVPVRKL